MRKALRQEGSAPQRDGGACAASYQLSFTGHFNLNTLQENSDVSAKTLADLFQNNIYLVSCHSKGTESDMMVHWSVSHINRVLDSIPRFGSVPFVPTLQQRNVKQMLVCRSVVLP